MHTYIRRHVWLCMYVCIDLSIYVCRRVSVFIYIYIYIDIYRYKYRYNNGFRRLVACMYLRR